MTEFHFDSKLIAKDVIGNLTDSIKTTPRDTSIPEVQGRGTFNAALLLQAGLRALLPVGEREGVALPKIFPNDAKELQDAQRNYAEVFGSGKEANEAQNDVAFISIRLAAKQLLEQGYKAFASEVKAWADMQAPVYPAANASEVQNKLKL